MSQMTSSAGGLATSSSREGRFVHEGGENLSLSKGQHPKCLCGLYAIISKSGTIENPGRLFFGCPRYNDLDVAEKLSYCKFFVWVDMVFDLNGKNVGLKEVAVTDDLVGGFRETLLELQDRVGVLENNENAVVKKDWKNVYFNLYLSAGFIVLIYVVVFNCSTKA
ncbi:hypothetical protein Ahy_A07g036199 [Arachis hypogaea]|uniref:GRF-type domain-containing protein n=1 Tax=Arachis hypogaea TaxID=3818 RepID=A0A445CFF9_ARAHY|nr:hypothetical protein Ahy_A07g036199 [Arachis hypogaea]